MTAGTPAPVGGPSYAPQLVSRLDGVSARSITVLTALNANGVVDMTFGIEQAGSLAILVPCLILIARHGNRAFWPAFNALLIAFTIYLGLGTLFANPSENGDMAGQICITYLGAVLIIWGMASYTAALGNSPQLRRFLGFLRDAFVVSAGSVLASPFLYTFYVNLPPSSIDRMGGFFGNPNEAAIAADCALGLVLAIPYRMYLVQVSALFAIAIAIVLPFSKAAITAAIIIIVWQFLKKLRGIMLLIVPLLGLVAIIMIEDPSGIIDGIVNSEILALDAHQQQRLLDVGHILSGQLNEETTTGRSDLWLITIQRAWEMFPLGAGLGSRHSIIGGVVENDVWLGVHNTFLLFLGEAGPAAFAALLVSFALLAYAAVKSARGELERILIFLLFIDMMGSHTTFSVRFENLTLGVTMGLLSFSASAAVRRQVIAVAAHRVRR